MSIKVLLADDHKITRYGLRIIIEKQTDMEVVGEAENGIKAVELVSTLLPDIVIMDVNMPGLNGVEATKEILAASPETKVIALSMYSDSIYVKGMFNSGASGYLVKDCAFDEILMAISVVNSGKAFLSSSIADMVVKEYYIEQNPLKVEPESLVMKELTQRENEVLKLIVEGYDPEQIAARLSISIKTVSTHRRNIMDKLGIYNNVDLVKYALRKGITSI